MVEDDDVTFRKRGVPARGSDADARKEHGESLRGQGTSPGESARLLSTVFPMPWLS